MNKIIKDPTYNIYKRGGNVERKGDEITKDDLKKLADAKKDPDSGLGLELIQNLKQLRDELDPDEKDLNKFLDKLSEEQLKRLLLSGGGRVIDLSKYRKSKDPKVKTINLAQGDFNKTVAGLSDSDKDLIKQLLRKSGVLVGD
jgi:hypothetical protein|tara:strand:+ start:324 stop:752 length:429 start_codon:yes stop_codon:yes gene_type:complete